MSAKLFIIGNFLTDRQQFVPINQTRSNVLSCDIGCLQGCVLSLLILSKRSNTDFIQTELNNV